MPRNSSGTYTLPASNPVVTNTPISSNGWANPTLADISAALTESLAKTGVTTPTANLPMGGLVHTNVGVATNLNQYSRADQVQNSDFIKLNSVAQPTANNYTAALPLSPTAFVQDQMLIIEFPSTNTGTPVTLSINGSSARQLLKANGTALAAGNCRVGVPFIIIYDGTNWRMIIDSTGLTSSEITTSLGYTPVNKAGDTMTGELQLPNSTPSAALKAASKGYVDAQISGLPANVASFNTRTGAVTLLSADVTGALGYTPVNKAGDTMGGSLNMGNFDLSAIRSASFNSQITVSPTTGAVTVNFANGQKQKLTQTGNVTLTLSFPGPGHYQLWMVHGANTVTWPTIGATFQWLNSTTAPTLNSSTYGGVVNFYYDGTFTMASYTKVGTP